TLRPSGEKTPSRMAAGASKSFSAAPLPSAGCHQSELAVVREDTYITRLPSGDHSGRSLKPSRVRRSAVCEAREAPQISLLEPAPCLSKATRVPSGDSRGWA